MLSPSVLFVSQSDGFTLVTTLVSALDNGTTGIKLSKAGGALTIRHASVTATTYDGYGNYLVTLDATDTGTLGRLRVQFTDATTNLPVWADFEVVTANVYNALIAGTDNLDVNMLKVGPTGAGTAQTARDLGLALPAAAPNATGGLLAGVVRGSTAQAGNGTTITLDASASATNDLYKGMAIYLISGNGAGQARTIITYGGGNKVATVDRAWATNPNNTTVFAILPADSPALTTALAVTAAVSKVVVFSGTAQTGSTTNTIKLSAAASATNNIYNGDLITITGGTGLGQTRTIISYVGSTKIATVDKNWNTTPDNTSTFDIYASTTPSVFSDQGVAQAGSSSTITLAATASATSSIYNGSIVTILSGTDAGDTSEITAYNGSTKVATVSPNFAVAPDTTSAYAVIPTQSGTGVTPGTQDANVVSWAGTAVAVNVAGVPKVDVAYTLGSASVGAAGYVGVDWGQVANKTTTNALTGTTIAATQQVDVNTIKTNPVVNAGTVTFPTNATLASTTNITAGTITTTTSLTNLPSITANWLTAAGINAGALNGKGDWVLSSSYTAPDNAGIAAGAASAASAATDAGTAATNTTTLLARLGAFAGSGVNTVLGFFKALLSKTATTPSDVGGTFDPSTDSTEAIRDRGDVAWITATGFSTLDAAGVRNAVGLATASLDTDFSTVNATLATIAGYIDTEVAAIKLTTDHLATALELDSGAYRYTTAALANAPTGGGTAPTVVQIRQEMDANSVKLIAIDAKTSQLRFTIPLHVDATANASGDTTITVTGPVAIGGNVNILAGDSYYDADDRALSWSSTAWPDLTSATLALVTFPPDGGTQFTAVPTVVTPTGTAEIQLELTSAQTTSLVRGKYPFHIVATLSNGHVVTLVHASWGVSL